MYVLPTFLVLLLFLMAWLVKKVRDPVALVLLLSLLALAAAVTLD